MKEIDASPFTDAICPEPGPKTAAFGNMGTPISDAPKSAQGVLAEVQFAELGDYTPTKIPGGGSY
jgi:hypothetical protein